MPAPAARGAKPPRPKQQPSFEVCKRNALSKLDKSPKGSLDEPTAPLVHDINRHPDYVTTSSCSGRVSLFATFGDERNRGGRWLFVQHATVTIREVTDALTPPPTQPATPPPELVLFKHEPGILHVQCRHLEAAKRLLQACSRPALRRPPPPGRLRRSPPPRTAACPPTRQPVSPSVRPPARPPSLHRAPSAGGTQRRLPRVGPGALGIGKGMSIVSSK